MHAEVWEPLAGIDGPCDHIAFCYAGQTATVSMQFAGVAGRHVRELILKFRTVVVLCGENEAPGGIVPAPAISSLPKLGRGEHPSWTFPLLRLIDSPPLKQYQLMYPMLLAHCFLISLDNLVHVIASADVEAAWNSETPSGSVA